MTFDSDFAQVDSCAILVRVVHFFTPLHAFTLGAAFFRFFDCVSLRKCCIFGFLLCVCVLKRSKIVCK